MYFSGIMCYMVLLALLFAFAVSGQGQNNVLGDTSCNSEASGHDADDCALLSSHDELQNLELLQMDVQLKSLEPAAPAPKDKVAPAMVETTSASNSAKVEARFASLLTEGSTPLSTDLHVAEHEHFFGAMSSFVQRMIAKTREHSIITRVVTDRLAMPYSMAIWIGLLLIGAICLLSVLVSWFRETSEEKSRPAEQLMQGSPDSPERQRVQRERYLNPESPQDADDADVPASSGPPPICPSLILPHTEARFMISTDRLMCASGELDIRGTSGRKLLHGSIENSPAEPGTSSLSRRTLSIASCGCEDDPRVSVVAHMRDSKDGPLAHGGPSQGSATQMEIFGKGHDFYGCLEPAPAALGGGFQLRKDGRVVMTIKTGTGADFLNMTAASWDGPILATAGKHVRVGSQTLESHDTWKLQVKPGVDAVLISACMLSAIVFRQ